MRILFLSTWFPYPPTHGGKIRAFHLITGLARRHEVALISFEDAPVESQWIEEIHKYCARVELVKQDPFQRNRLKKIMGLFSPLPSDVAATYSAEMERKIQSIIDEWHPDVIHAETFVTARYGLNSRDIIRVVDVDNIMTRMMWDGYQQTKSFPERLRRLLAWWKFSRYEKHLYRQFDLCLTVSTDDQRRLMEMFSIPESKLGVIPNGVSIDGEPELSNSPKHGTLIYPGSLTYQANFDAMAYFLEEIFPHICNEAPEVTLKVTGSTKDVPLHLFPQYDQVTFTGFVPDVRPLIIESWICIVPLRVGGGTRIKILEAMALGTPVVSTYKGAEGLDLIDGVHLLLADTPEQFARQVIRLLHDEKLRQDLSAQARQFVEEKYQWDKIQSDLCDLVEGLPQRQRFSEER